MTKKRNSHGGRRKGAGRKPAPVKMISFRVSVSPATHEWFRTEAARRGQSVSSLYAIAANEYAAEHLAASTAPREDGTK